jgi:hypothetical protein
MAEELKKAPMKLPPATYEVKITVEAVFDQSVGPEASKLWDASGITIALTDLLRHLIKSPKIIPIQSISTN